MNLWKKLICFVLAFGAFLTMTCCTIEATTVYAPAPPKEDVAEATWEPVIAYAAEPVQARCRELIESASKEVKVIEPLDRTKPIYEVYKNGWRVWDATADVQWMIRDFCEQYDLPEKMIYGLVTKESTFVPNLESFDGGCWGLAQINTYWITGANITHFTDDYRDRDLCDPYDNLLTLAEMMCYARDTYGLDYNTKMGQNHYLYWHATGKSPVNVTWIGPGATKAFGFADELVTLQS